MPECISGFLKPSSFCAIAWMTWMQCRYCLYSVLQYSMSFAANRACSSALEIGSLVSGRLSGKREQFLSLCFTAHRPRLALKLCILLRCCGRYRRGFEKFGPVAACDVAKRLN